MSRATTTVVVALLALAALAGCASPSGPGDDGTTATAADGTTAAGTTDGNASTAETTRNDATGTTEAGDSGAEPTASDTTGPGDGPTATFRSDGSELATISLEVARTDAEHRRGLMGRESLAADHGMVFVFESAGDRVFWMKDTLIPLDMIFVSENGTVINVEHAHVQPNASNSELERYRSDAPAQYVVEVNRGFANETGIGPGTQVEFENLNASASNGSNGSGESNVSGSVGASVPDAATTRAHVGI
ncbi:DUF192 domain-containing protein [Halomarina litorea]|uniref:DUF192 domain-containing protein n=1 Tax=Halomarina litorea TaxID=2961595 RepID=UPI0020C1D521|nr:DUF192 domain-containing protein [Halomarina sp. BCD28]